MPLVTLVTGIAVFYLNKSTTELENNSKVISSQVQRISEEQKMRLEELEQDRDFKFKIYDLLTSAMQDEKNREQRLEVTRVFIKTMVKEEEMRDALLSTLLLTEGVTPTIKDRVINDLNAKNSFGDYEMPKSDNSSGKWRVDIFYLEETQQTSYQIANALKDKLPGELTVNVRMLPTLVNLKNSYRIKKNTIRYEEGEEEKANNILSALSAKGSRLEIARMKIKYNTPKYISIFIAG